ncbi:MAG: hypothetical protein ABI564_14725 [Ideonella sp.]
MHSKTLALIAYTQPDGEKGKQTAFNFISGMSGGGAKRAGTRPVIASSEEAYSSTCRALFREALDAMVVSVAAARRPGR